MRFGPAHPPDRPQRRRARRAPRPRELLSRAEVAGDRAAEYAGFDSVGPGAHERHRRPTRRAGWRPGCGRASAPCAAARAPRWWARTAGSRGCSTSTARRRGPGDRLRLPPPRGGRAGSAAACGRASRARAVPRDPRRSTPARRAGPAELAERFGTPLYVVRRRAHRGRGARVPGRGRAGRDRRLLGQVEPPDGPGGPPPPGRLLGRGGLGLRVPHRPPRGRAGLADRLQRARSRRSRSCAARCREGATVDRRRASSRCARSPAWRRTPAPARAWACGSCPPDREGRDRFGVPARMAPAAASVLARAGLPLTGLHIHLGAYQLGPLPPTGPPIHGVTVQYPVPVARFADAAARLRETAERVGGIEWLDLGGGWPAAAGLGGAPRRGARGPRAPTRPPHHPGARPRAHPRRRLAARAGGRAPRTRARWWSTPASPRCRACCGSARRCTPPSRATAPSAPRTCSGRSACSTTPSPARCRWRRCGWATWSGSARPAPTRWPRRRPSSTSARARCWSRAAARHPAARARDRRRGARRPGGAPAGGAGGARGVGHVTAIRVRAGRWADSAKMMAAARAAESVDGVERALLLHGDARQPRGGRVDWASRTPALDGAGPDDLVLAVSGARAEAGLAAAEEVLDARPVRRRRRAGRARAPPRSLARAEGDLAVISVPGEYAALEAHKALGAGMDVLLFSDGVSLEDEVALKRRAHELGLLVMGPGAGTAIIDGLALGFANVVARGSVGVVAAAGTGAQEVTVLRRPGGRRRSAAATAPAAATSRTRWGRSRPSTPSPASPRTTRPTSSCASPSRPRPRSPSGCCGPWPPPGMPAAACMVGGGVEPVAGVHLAATLEEAALAAARLAGHASEPPGPPRADWVTGGRGARPVLGRDALQRGRRDPGRAPRERGHQRPGRAGPGACEGEPRGPRVPRSRRGGVHPRPAPPHDRPGRARGAPGRGGGRPRGGRSADRRRPRLREPPRPRRRARPGHPRGPRDPAPARGGGLRAGHRGRSAGAQPPGGRPAPRPASAWPPPTPPPHGSPRPSSGEDPPRHLLHQAAGRGRPRAVAGRGARRPRARRGAVGAVGRRGRLLPRAAGHGPPGAGGAPAGRGRCATASCATPTCWPTACGPRGRPTCTTPRTACRRDRCWPCAPRGSCPPWSAPSTTSTTSASPVLVECQRASIEDVDHRVCVSAHWAEAIARDHGVDRARDPERGRR